MAPRIMLIKMYRLVNQAVVHEDITLQSTQINLNNGILIKYSREGNLNIYLKLT